MATVTSALAGGMFMADFARELRNSLRHHALLLIAGGAVFAAGYGLALGSGFLLAASPLGFAVSYVGVASLFVGFAIFLFKLARMALVEKPERPAAELLRWFKDDLLHPARLANGITGMVFVFLLMGGFTMAKNTVPRFGGFRWDAQLAEFDRILHFGWYPHDLLQPVLGQPWITWLIDRNYVLWFPVLFASCFVASFLRERSFERHRFLLALCMAWGAGGVASALAFASAGPVYFAQVTGAASPYAGHFIYLHNVDAAMGMKALAIQQKLWLTYTGEPSVSLISAMPSMHSAITVLVFLACWRVGGWLRPSVTVFTALILLGSVHLGWHYAADAYAGIAIAIVAWLFAAWITRWWMTGKAA